MLFDEARTVDQRVHGQLAPYFCATGLIITLQGMLRWVWVEKVWITRNRASTPKPSARNGTI